ncbi:MAG: type III pantothenate kinase [Coriobacteriales bacterium]|jgi:type III pantothenate kinase|nr:type III pantothenate kinase [Coriobacteriales bacterium]
MLLAVDVGNTQTCLGLYDGVDKLASWRMTTIATDTADELAMRLKSMLVMDGLAASFVSDIAISSVVPNLTEQWRKAGERSARRPPMVLSYEIAAPFVNIDYPNPEEIGADRIAVAAAAVELYGAPVMIVDFGTATNIEVIDKRGFFIGGIICPGLATSAEALFRAAAKLSSISIEVPASVIGRNTRDAVRSGLTFGEIDRIDGLVKRVFHELGYTTKVIATGGLSPRVSGLSQTIDIINDDLTLIGLRIIYNQVNGEKP